MKRLKPIVIKKVEKKAIEKIREEAEHEYNLNGYTKKEMGLFIKNLKQY